MIDNNNIHLATRRHLRSPGDVLENGEPLGHGGHQRQWKPFNPAASGRWRYVAGLEHRLLVGNDTIALTP